MRLDRYTNNDFRRGASRPTEAFWLLISSLLVSSWLPGSAWRATLLRLFGASIGKGVVFKPRVVVKFPWRLHIGDFCWIGERVWIDNLTDVRLGDHVCLSQSAYLCTGSHDWSHENFDLITKPILIESHAWICANAMLAPGTIVEQGAVLAFGAIGHGRLSKWQIYTSSGERIERKIISGVTTPNSSTV